MRTLTVGVRRFAPTSRSGLWPHFWVGVAVVRWGLVVAPLGLWKGSVCEVFLQRACADIPNSVAQTQRRKHLCEPVARSVEVWFHHDWHALRNLCMSLSPALPHLRLYVRVALCVDLRMAVCMHGFAQLT